MVCYVYGEIQFDWSFYPRVLSFSTNRITAKFWQSGKICKFVREPKTILQQFTKVSEHQKQFYKICQKAGANRITEKFTPLIVLLFFTLFLMTQTHSFFVLFYKNFYKDTHNST